MNDKQIAKVRKELKRTQQAMRMTKCDGDKVTLRKLSRDLNLALSRLVGGRDG